MIGLPPLAAGDPFFRRVLLVSCPETLGTGEIGPGLRQALWEERAGILQWALEGLRRVLRSARAGEGFPRPPGGDNAQALGASRRADRAL